MSSRPTMPLGLILITIGGMIYLSFRPTSLLLFHTLGALGLMPLVDAWRSAVAAWMPGDFVVYSLPGGLWSAAYALLVWGLLRHTAAPLRVAIAAIIPLTGVVSELMQLAGLLPGTFDVADLLCYALPLLFLIIYVIIKHFSIWQVFSTASVASN